MRVPNGPAFQDVAILIPDTRMGVARFISLFRNVENAILVPHNVVGPTHASPHCDEFALRRENLYPSVGAITNVNLAVWANQKAVDQMEFSWFLLARLSPGLDQLAFAGKSVHPGITVPIGYVNVSGRASPAPADKLAAGGLLLGTSPS